MNMDFRKHAPAPLAPIAFQIPPAVRATLSNGLRVILFRDTRVPLLNLRLIFKFGDIDDPQGSTGLTSALASMLNEGTESYSSRQLAEEVERLGASLGASSGSDSTVIAASALSLYTDDIVKLLAELALRPTFPESELELYKKNTVEGLKFQRSQASFLADEQFARHVYGAHPYSVVSPAAADVEKITREALTKHHRIAVDPGHASLIAVGDFEPDAFLALLEKEFEGWVAGSHGRGGFPEPPTPSERRLIIVDRPGSAQSNILLGNIGLSRDDPDYFPSLVLNQVLGAGASSRLFMNLREDKGYTYGAYSKFTARRFGGDFEASAEVRTEVTGASFDEFMKELSRIREEEVSRQELDDAKNYLTGVFPLRAETQDGLTNLLVHQEIYSLEEDYLRTYRDKVAAVTVQDLQRAALKHIHPESLTMVVVGDGGEILRQCGHWSEEVDCFDTEGRSIDPSALIAKSERAEIDLTGAWDLILDFQGKNVSVTLTLEQDNSKLTGSLDSFFGGGTVTGGRVSGDVFTATAETDVQGRKLEMSLTGRIVDGKLTGTVKSPAVPTEIVFEGKRK